MRFLVLMLLAALLPCSAMAGNPTTISFDCAPWDGPTLVVSVGAPDVMINAEIWADGYNDLIKGERTILINNKFPDKDTKATGRASFRETRHPTDTPHTSPEENVTIHFDTLELKDGGKAAGFIETKQGMKYPFGGNIVSGGPCG